MIKDLIYRSASNQDTDKIVRLVKSILPEFDQEFDANTSEQDLLDIEQTYIDNGGAFIVIEDGEHEIVGTVALLRIDSDTCKLRKLYVAREARGLKLGAKLVEMVIARADQLGFKTIYLETVHSMTAAIRLYEKFGFQIVDGTVATSPRCDIVMAKSLERE